MDRLLVNPKYRQAWSNHGWRDLDAVITHFLPGHKRRDVTVRETAFRSSDGGDVKVFFKLYDHGGGDGRFWMRASKARREFDNYGTLADLGIPAAEAIACGDERDGVGRLTRAFILTRAVPDACTLEEFFRERPPWSERRAVLTQLSSSLRRLHAASFFCNDLVWRNILVSRTNARKPTVFLIDCPRGGRAAFGIRRRQLRDLASLDKSAKTFCTRGERLRFLLDYLGKTKLDTAARALALACREYRRKRWPEDWRGK